MRHRESSILPRFRGETPFRSRSSRRAGELALAVEDVLPGEPDRDPDHTEYHRSRDHDPAPDPDRVWGVPVRKGGCRAKLVSGSAAQTFRRPAASLATQPTTLLRSSHSPTAQTGRRRQEETPSRTPPTRRQRRHAQPDRPRDRDLPQLDVLGRARERAHHPGQSRRPAAALPHPHHAGRRRRRRALAIRSHARPDHVPPTGAQRLASANVRSPRCERRASSR
jgi:hypothetical protein